MKLYSVSCEFVQLFQIRVKARSPEDARRLAKRQLIGHGVMHECGGYVGQTIRAGTVIEAIVEDDDG